MPDATTSTRPARRLLLLRWLGRRRRTGVETLQPLRVGTPVTALHFTAPDDCDTAETVRAAGATISPVPWMRLAVCDDVVAPPDGAESEPSRPSTSHLCDELDAVVDRVADEVLPGTYSVVVGRLKGGGGTPDPLEVTVTSAETFAAAVAQHVQEHTGDPRPVEVTVDPEVRGGILRAGGRSIGTFSYTNAPDVPGGRQ